ncbi:hypothetical protein H2199_002360 [Coniosporium tulheliwenetii]|uniref:Uncharacterized protein n=1 Tax=Coniosporium tulheliwenetii TaxID=3383036 RepID=A0ACC2ZIJ7_9PEZI|nr:hypothetical protein H2199_002360 [Cladosporium sp. JES 115]
MSSPIVPPAEKRSERLQAMWAFVDKLASDMQAGPRQALPATPQSMTCVRSADAGQTSQPAPRAARQTTPCPSNTIQRMSSQSSNRSQAGAGTDDEATDNEPVQDGPAWLAVGELEGRYIKVPSTDLEKNVQMRVAKEMRFWAVRNRHWARDAYDTRSCVRLRLSSMACTLAIDGGINVACRTCTNKRMACMRVVDGDLCLMPLEESIRGGEDDNEARRWFMAEGTFRSPRELWA